MWFCVCLHLLHFLHKSETSKIGSFIQYVCVRVVLTGGEGRAWRRQNYQIKLAVESGYSNLYKMRVKVSPSDGKAKLLSNLSQL